MLNQPTIEKLNTMKLHGMAEAFRAQLETADMSQLAFEERFGLLVDQQWLWKENRALAHRLRAARLKERGVIEVRTLEGHSARLTINIPADWIANSCGPWPTAIGCATAKTFC